MSSSGDPFVNYTKPEDLQAPANKGLVAAYIGRNFRNRSTSRRREEASLHKETSKEQKSIVPVDPARNTSVPHLTFGRILSPFSLHYPRAGVWTDPFDALPIEQRAVIPKTMQYFMEVYAPSHLIREKHSSIWGGNAELQQYFRFAVDHKSMFSALMAISLCHIIMEEKGGIAEDGDMLFYYGIALMDVRTALSVRSPSPNDALVASVMGLMAVDAESQHSTYIGEDSVALWKDGEGLDMLRFNTIHGPVYRGYKDNHFTDCDD
ncbi:hypothetical protein LTS07_006242 [Exophiala sideris]|uniref:Transcription factor domain-containing protein n=1 Tax=Exophiala sideris TaxID=1016849 RepID=A0ABR0J6T8_9EURO|nr:hypothetical protein LTS07_006242 [Exophiala sideris]KAK5035731.1 hypothetical protein LTR13_005861 [Exophiala sideris]KAK5057366.1 hypothetical protein LTR69_007406 [Exophiala sideris]KAK5181660.1 hypothetical protein LTR44_005859 [Eurotiomycetes sp. CCFEE 6388]